MNRVNSRFLQSVQRMDVATFLKVVNFNTWVGISGSARWVSKMADGWLYAFIPLLAVVIAPDKVGQVCVTLGAAFVCERIIYLTLKKGIKRNRPPNAIPGFVSVIKAADEFSFPSGHTSGAFLAVTLLVLFFPGFSFHLLYFWALAVAFSRVVLGVHFPLDTVAGAILGMMTAKALYSVL